MTTLYHYCSTLSFHSIIKSRSIWLSSLSLSNDSMEGKYVSSIFIQLAASHGLSPFEREQFVKLLISLEDRFDGLGFCLSEEGDLLSQWRGYASDATGVAIGFSKEYLEELGKVNEIEEPPGFTLEKVEYDPVKQAVLAETFYVKFKKHLENGALKIPGRKSMLDTRRDEEIEEENVVLRGAYRDLVGELLALFPKWFSMKSKAFNEEHEWRLTSIFKHFAKEPCLYKPLGDRLIPYRKVSLIKLTTNPIKEVIVGPKNITPCRVIQGFLKQNNLIDDVLIKRSAASYR